MKKTVFLIFLFVIFTCAVCLCPSVTNADRAVITELQKYIFGASVKLMSFIDDEMYLICTWTPLAIGCFCFLKNRLYKDAAIFLLAPYSAYLFNKIFKALIARPRPPIELQLVEHKQSFSYVSNHTFITSVLWGMVIFYLFKYCKNKFIKISGTVVSAFVILATGISRIFLGLHNPTDVIGAYILAGIFVMIFVKIINNVGGTEKLFEN